MAFTADWDEAAPAGADAASSGDDEIRTFKVQISDRLKGMFYGFVGGATENTLAQHAQYITFYEQASVSQPSAGFGRLYCKAVSTKCELFWQDEDGDEIQLTTGGKWNGAVLADDSIDSQHYIALSIDREHLAADIVDGTKIEDDAIDSEHYAAASIDDEHLGADVMHDAEGGYQYADVDSTKTKVYTKYFTGTLDGDSQTDVAHGITGIDKILSVSVICYDTGGKYLTQEAYAAAAANAAFAVYFDGTNVEIQIVGSQHQSQKYRIKIDYIL